MGGLFLEYWPMPGSIKRHSQSQDYSITIGKPARSARARYYGCPARYVPHHFSVIVTEIYEFFFILRMSKSYAIIRT